MPGRQAASVLLSEAEVDVLTRITRRQTAPQHLVRRARMILLMHLGLGNTDLTRRLEVSRSNAELRRRRWNEGLAARRACDAEALPALIEQQLSDAPRSGAPPKFSAEAISQIIALSLRPPSDFGRPVTHWTPAELAEEAVRQGIVEAISPRTVGRFLK